MIDLAPLMGRIIVKRREDEMTAGGLYIPKGSREMQATEGEVVAVGSEVDITKVGATVFWGKYSGAEIERDRVKYIIMDQEDLLCIVKPATNA